RARAFTIAALEEAATSGHSLLPKDKVVETVRGYPVRPECPLTGDMLGALDMTPEVVRVKIGPDVAMQLERYSVIGCSVRKQVLGRIGGQRHKVSQDWGQLLNKKFGPSQDPEELRAREEKSAALRELAEARISVLAGPAGAGKTTVLGILC